MQRELSTLLGIRQGGVNKMQRGGAARATALLQTTTGAADHTTPNQHRRSRPLERGRPRPWLYPAGTAGGTPRHALRGRRCVRPGVATRTGAGMLLLHMPARGPGGVAGNRPPQPCAVVAQPRPHKTGGVGVARCPRMNRHRAATRDREENPRSDHAAKGEGATLHQPRFAACPQRGTGGERVAVFTRKGARHNGTYANPQGAQRLRSNFA